MPEIVKWYPNPGPQTEAFRYSWVDEIFFGGAKGGGKTEFLLFDFIHPNYITNTNYRGIIFRRTFPRLREIIERSHKYFTRFPDAPVYSQSDKSWTFNSGAKMFFGHCQHEESKYDYQGHEYHYMGFDQLEEFTSPQYEFLKAQARTSDPTIKVRIRATGNPGNVGHLWVKNRFIDRKEPLKVYSDRNGLTKLFIPSKVWDNPALIKSDPMYVKRLENLPEEDRKALLEGNWDIFSGQYFSEWTPDIHVVRPYTIPSEWKRFIAGDYGHKKPSSIGWYAVKPEGGIVRYREIYKEGFYYDDLAREICRLSKNENISYAVFDPAVFGDKQHHKEAREGKSGAEVMQEVISDIMGDKSFPVVRGDNRRIEGWRTLKQLLRVIDGETQFEVFSNCTGFITTFPANVHDQTRPEDLDTDGEDHSADEARYAAMSRPPESEEEVEEEINENSAWGRYLLKQQSEETIYARS